MNLLQYCFCFLFWFFDFEACKILVLWWGIKCTHTALKDGVLTTGPPVYYFYFPSFLLCTAATAKSLQSCPTLCDPIPGILQARALEWVAISFSNAWKWKVKVKSLSHVWLFETPWTAAYQAPPSMGFSRQEYWSGVPLPSVLLRTTDC